MLQGEDLFFRVQLRNYEKTYCSGVLAMKVGGLRRYAPGIKLIIGNFKKPSSPSKIEKKNHSRIKLLNNVKSKVDVLQVAFW